MTDDDRDTERSSIPLKRYPDPAASFRIDDGEPVVRELNPAFRRRFGALGVPIELAALFDRLGVEPVEDGTHLRALVTDGGRSSSSVPITVDGGQERTFLRVIHGIDEGSIGYLLFSRSPSIDDGATMDEDSATDEAATAMVGAEQVASVISHDLRNPLDVAKARLRAGRETGDERHFDHVANAHDRMERIINDVLTLARGRESIDPEASVDLRAAAESAWRTVETEDATLRVETELPTVVADRSRLERLFENLFRNAVEHGSTGSRGRERSDDRNIEDDEGLCVTIGRVADDPSGIFVEDDGVGIPPEDRPNVFEPGYSSHNGGTGLGLAIVEGIARGHGWCISATAGEAGGARFELTGLEIEDRSDDAEVGESGDDDV